MRWSVGALALLLAGAFVCPAARAEEPPPLRPKGEPPALYKVIPSGRYSVKIKGLLTTTCGRAIEIELLRLPEVEAAVVDFDSEELVVTVKLNYKLKVSTLRRTLREASHWVNMGTDYTVGEITYLP